MQNDREVLMKRIERASNPMVKTLLSALCLIVLSCGGSESSSETPPETVIPKPMITGYTATATRIMVRWAAIQSVVKYVVYWKHPSGYQESEIVYDTVYSIPVESDSTYSINVATVDWQNEEGPLSDTLTASSLVALTKPTDVVVYDITADSVTVSWEAVADSTGYDIYRKTSDSENVKVNSEPVTALSFTDTGLSYGTSYLYSVCALRGDESSFSDTVPATTVASTIPAPSDLVVSSRDVGRISMRWSAVSGATGYRLYFGRKNDLDVTATTVLTDTSYTLRYFSDFANEAVYIRVAAVDGVSAVGAKSPAIREELHQSVDFIGTPSSLNARGTSEVATTLSWSSVSQANRYILYRADSENGDYYSIDSCSNLETERVIRGLKPGKSYYFKVAACYYDSYISQYYPGMASAPIKVTTNAISKPTVPAGFRVDSVASTAVKLKWTRSDVLTSYYIYQANSLNGIYYKCDNYPLSAADCVIASGNFGLTIEPGTTYYFKIQAENALGKSPLSEPVSVTTNPINPDSGICFKNSFSTVRSLAGVKFGNAWHKPLSWQQKTDYLTCSPGTYFVEAWNTSTESWEVISTSGFTVTENTLYQIEISDTTITLVNQGQPFTSAPLAAKSKGFNERQTVNLVSDIHEYLKK